MSICDNEQKQTCMCHEKRFSYRAKQYLCHCTYEKVFDTNPKPLYHRIESFCAGTFKYEFSIDYDAIKEQGPFNDDNDVSVAVFIVKVVAAKDRSRKYFFQEKQDRLNVLVSFLNHMVCGNATEVTNMFWFFKNFVMFAFHRSMTPMETHQRMWQRKS